MTIAQVDMAEVMSGLTMQVQVTGVRMLRVRLWLGLRVLKLAAMIMGCGIAVSLDD